MRRSLLVVLSGVVVLLTGASPAFADTEISDSWTGDRGIAPHRLVDSSAKAGMTVHYSQTAFGTDEYPGREWWTVDQISVRPPKMRGIRDHQLVAWRFIVERGKIGTGAWAPPDWKVTYRSPRQWSMAYVDYPAVFSKMSVPVAVPGAHSAGDSWAYRVKVKMLWYRRDGAIQATALHGVDYYRTHFSDYVFEAPVITSRSPY